MTPFDVLLDLAVRVLLLSLPLTIALLAFRRLILSRTRNIWLYAAMVGYAVFSAVGVLPWVLGSDTTSIAFFLFAIFCPLVWALVILVSGSGRQNLYKPTEAAEIGHETEPVVARLETLVLKDPIAPEPAAVPIFRHHGSPPLEKRKVPANVMGIARSMRGRATSEARRVRKLLPPPSPEHRDLPFIR